MLTEQEWASTATKSERGAMESSADFPLAQFSASAHSTFLSTSLRTSSHQPSPQDVPSSSNRPRKRPRLRS